MQLSKLIWVAVVLGLSSCATAPELYPSHPLNEQIVKVRTGFEAKLTNRACVAKTDPAAPDSSPGCPMEKITAYPLEDPGFREIANKLNFICNLAGARYKICIDKPGFCRFSYAKPQGCFLGLCKEQRHETYVPGYDMEFLLAANAKCANPEQHDLWWEPGKPDQ